MKKTTSRFRLSITTQLATLCLLLGSLPVHATNDSSSSLLDPDSSGITYQTRDQYFNVNTTTDTATGTNVPSTNTWPYGVENMQVFCGPTLTSPFRQMLGIGEYAYDFGVSSADANAPFAKSVAYSYNYRYTYNCSSTFYQTCTDYGWIRMYSVKDVETATCGAISYLWENTGAHT